MKFPRISLAVLTIALAAEGDLRADDLPGREDRLAGRSAVGERFAPERVQRLQQRAESLASELEGLVEEISRETGRTRELYPRAEGVMHEVTRFQSALDAGTGRERVNRAFQTLDKSLRALLDSLQFTKDASLQSRMARIGYSEQQLQHDIAEDDQTEGVRPDVIARQADALKTESRQLAEAARTALDGNEGGEQLRMAISQFAEDAERFDHIFDKTGTSNQAVREFEAVDQSWRNVVAQYNQSGRSAYLYRRLMRVNTIHQQLHKLLEAQTERPALEYRDRD